MIAKLHTDMSITDYHADKSHISKSGLAKFADCPARYKHYYIDGGEQEQTDSLRLGNAVHVLALEPELWKSNYHILPATYWNDKGEEKEWRHDKRMQVVKDQIALAGNKTILKKSEYDLIESMANSLAKNTYAVSLLKTPGYVEASIFWEDEEGNKLKCRPDKMGNDGLNCDLKIARSVKPDVFYRDAFNYGYHLSAAITAQGFKAHFERDQDNYVFIAVEQEAPYMVECFEVMKPISDLIDMNYLDYGTMQLSLLLSRMNECIVNNLWPQYQGKIGAMKLPEWELTKLINQGA